MNTLWKLWVTLTLLYLLLSSHRGEVESGVRAGYRVGMAVLGVLSQERCGG
jgi:sulfopyruvate decarboxylase TPP-binding subunit